MFLEKNCCVSFFGQIDFSESFTGSEESEIHGAWWKFSILSHEQISGSVQWLWGCHEKTVFMECGKVFLVKISQLWFIPYIIDFGFYPLERRVLVVNFTHLKARYRELLNDLGIEGALLIRKVVKKQPHPFVAGGVQSLEPLWMFPSMVGFPYKSSIWK